MNRSGYILFITIGITTGNLGCKKNYAPQAVSTDSHYLVVEAVINTGTDSSIIRLSRTVPLLSGARSAPETGAVVSIVSDANVIYPVVEKGNGLYLGAVINSNSQAKYSLKILTSDGKSYQSDFVIAKNSPPIDSLYWRLEGDHVSIYSDTHDPSNNSKYYRWNYVETYRFTSRYESLWVGTSIPKDTILPRTSSQQIYNCFGTDTSSSIILGSTAKLSKDIITHNPVVQISSKTSKLSIRYSILLNQYVLTPEAYNYYQQLKKNTEEIGTVFDPQPSELPGNVHCISSPAEPVIGYVTAGAPTQARIYINNYKLPYTWLADTTYAGCKVDTLGHAPWSLLEGLIVITREYVPISSPAIVSTPFCVDCTVRGTTKMPPWWTDDIN